MKPTQPIFDEFDVRVALIHACDDAGSQAAFAKRHNFNPSLVSQYIRGGRSPTSIILRILGFEKVTRYIRKPVMGR